MLLNKIGNHQFLFLRGPWQPPVEHVRVESRPGIDGVELTRLAKHGQPFRWLSQVDAAHGHEAHDFLIAYRELVGQDPVTVVKDNRNSDTDGFKCAVLAVEQVRLVALGTAMGGLNPPSRAWLECAGTLIAIANPEE